jgi:hypothetical protein
LGTFDEITLDQKKSQGSLFKEILWAISTADFFVALSAFEKDHLGFIEVVSRIRLKSLKMSFFKCKPNCKVPIE